jgi:hypothetical protein
MNGLSSSSNTMGMASNVMYGPSDTYNFDNQSEVFNEK